MTKKQKKMLARIILSIIILAGCVLVLDNIFNLAERAGISWIMVPFFLVAYLIAGYDILIKAIKGIFRGRLLMHTELTLVGVLSTMRNPL